MAMVDLAPQLTHKDPILGFTVDRDARKLILAFIALAFTIIGLGAIAALLVVFTRAPAVMLLNPEYYYMTLTYHGILMLTMFPHLFEMGLAIYAVTALLQSRLWSTKIAWAGFWLVLAGAATILVTIAFGDSSVMYTMYVPLRANGFFYLGHFVYAVGLLLEIVVFAMTVVIWKDKNPGKSLPLITYGAGVMMIILLTAIMSAVVAFLPTTLWAFRIFVTQVDPMVFKMAFWGMGHTLQYVNVIGMVLGWYMIAGYAHHAKPSSEKFSRMAFALYTLTTVPVFAHHLIVDPTWSAWYKYFGATLVGAFLGIPSTMHGFAVPASIEAAIRQRQRAAGQPVSRFSFFRGWGWKNPAMILLAFSVLAFGIGGFDGTMATTVPLNMIMHNTLFITAHFHGTLAMGMAGAYLAVAYYLLPALGVDIQLRGWTKFQAWCMSIGFVLLIGAMHWAAELGVPRRTQDIHYEAAKTLGASVPNWFTSMNFLAVGGTVAATGILTFVFIGLRSLIKGQPSDLRAPAKNGLWEEPWATDKSSKAASA